MSPRLLPLKHVAGINERALDEATDPDFTFRYVDIRTVGRGELVAEPQEMRFEDSPSRARRLVRPGDTIVSTVRTYLRAVWPVPESAHGLVVSTGFAVLTPCQVDPRYFSWWLRSDPFIEEVVARSVGVSYPAINALELGELKVRVPDAAEQRAIADFLDTETARIDALIAKKRYMVGLLRDRVVALRRQHLEALSASGDTLPLRRLVSCLDGQRVPLNREERASREGPYPYWGAGGVVDSIDDFLFDEELVLLGEDGAPFFDETRDVSFVVAGRVWVNNHIHVLRPSRVVNAEWLCHMLNAVDYASWITGSTRDKLTQEEMMQIRIPNAPLDVQATSAAKMRGLARLVAQATERLTTQITLLQEHRQALITAAVTGELDVTGAAA